MQKMSITRALVELKRLDERIQSAIGGGQYVGVTIGVDNNRKVYNSHQTVSDFEASIKGSYDRIDSLLVNRQKLKSAIVLSNANTKVDVLGKNMSVAEAIELKSTIAHRQSLLHVMQGQFNVANSHLNKLQTELDTAIDRGIQTIYGSDKSKVSTETFELVANPQKALKEPKLLDPADILNKIAKVKEEISALQSEVDFILSESNARTEIEVDY